MPQIDMSQMLRNIREGGDSKGPIIDGEARDLTGREDIDADTAQLADEPELPRGIRDREDSASLGGDIQGMLSRVPHGPLKRLDVGALHHKWQLMEQLEKTLPLNTFGLPDFFYRSDLLDVDLLSEGITELRGTTSGVGSPTAATTIPPMERGLAGTQFSDLMSHLGAAKVELNYHEGFPALPDGTPFWNRLMHESESAYDAFTFYLEIGGTRKLTDLHAYDLGDTKEWFHTYYWGIRVKAFDLYRVANSNRMRIKRMLDTEDTHYNVATKLMARIETIVGSVEFLEKLDELDPDKLVKVLDSVVKIQRVSAGLVAGGGVANTEPVKAPTTNIIMQQITDGQTVAAEVDDDVDILNDNPDMLELAQSLIIKSQESTNKL